MKTIHFFISLLLLTSLSGCQPDLFHDDPDQIDPNGCILLPNIFEEIELTRSPLTPRAEPFNLIKVFANDLVDFPGGKVKIFRNSSGGSAPCEGSFSEEFILPGTPMGTVLEYPLPENIQRCSPFDLVFEFWYEGCLLLRVIY